MMMSATTTKCIVAALFMCSGAVAQNNPAWYDRIKDEDTTGLVKRCFKKTARGDVPKTGDVCARRPKICYFGNQTCDDEPHPTTKCECQDRVWKCEPEICPGKCRTNDDCPTDEALYCFGTTFGQGCGIFFSKPVCSADSDCLASEVCDQRSSPCLANSRDKTCWPRCTPGDIIGNNCDESDTCLPDGHCVPTPCSVDGDCIDHFICDGGTCGGRRRCADDSDCAADSGFCVTTFCAAELGRCEYPNI